MCRLVVYKGTQPVRLSHVSLGIYVISVVILTFDQLLTRPAHSIIRQAFDPRLRLDHRRPINGDGFGVGWYDSVYDPELGIQPCVFTSVTPVCLHRKDLFLLSANYFEGLEQ